MYNLDPLFVAVPIETYGHLLHPIYKEVVSPMETEIRHLLIKFHILNES